MKYSANSIDDLLIQLYKDFDDLRYSAKGTRSEKKGEMKEKLGVLLNLTNPLARISLSINRGKPIGIFGELLWYMTGENNLNFIKHYLSPYTNEVEKSNPNRIHGGYGERLFGDINQFQSVIDILNAKRGSKRAVIQIFDKSDLSEDYVNIPCTCFIQFIIRDNKLHTFTTMRSNDIVLGLPYDIFAFTMFQETIAIELGVELGEYYHFITSAHMYKSDEIKLKEYINDGYQGYKNLMPKMPKSQSLLSVRKTLVEEEQKFRNDPYWELDNDKLDPYWVDYLRVLKIRALEKIHDKGLVISEISKINNTFYKSILDYKDNQSG